MKKKNLSVIICVISCLILAGCGTTKSTDKKETKESSTVIESTKSDKTDEQELESTTEITPNESEDIDYMALVNKLNKLPDDWEDKLITVSTTNSLGDEVEVEKKAYEAYLDLKADLENEGVYVDLDSARRSVAAQQEIMDDFIEEYGKTYAYKTVATPGYSEHHTGLALDLYLNIDGKDVYLNEDMVQYPEIWEKIHEKLAKYGFILRYLEGKEHITGYGYEPWHIRYLDNPEVAKEIMDKNITLEEYLGVVNSSDVNIDMGKSDIYSEDDIKEAMVLVKCKFQTYEGCELHSLSYAGDEEVNDDNLAMINLNNENDEEYKEVMKLVMSFHTPKTAVEGQDWKEDVEMENYNWLLGKTEDGDWEIVEIKKKR